MNNPLEICGWAALLEALRFANEIDPQQKKIPNPINLEAYIVIKRDRILHANYPDWKDGDIIEGATADIERPYVPAQAGRKRG